jgi:hypothetical protein
MSGNSSADETAIATLSASDTHLRRGRRVHAAERPIGCAQGADATSAVGAEGNQELIIFRKGDDGKWRISRYSFFTTDPA